ncbi:MAG: hypothetical protein K2X97_18000 [Mycobacteriaceae bacterium]|nr:hypothetical protein [Mycobacteriaceae bacterium]
MTPPHLEALIRRELAAGEHVLWSGQPASTRMLGGFAIWGFAVPWTVFALFWESMALLPWFAAKTPSWMQWSFGIAMPLFGLPFIAIGFGMLWWPIRAMRKARDTIYVLTERRLIRLVAGQTTEQVSVFVDRIGPIEKKEGRDGWGSVRVQTHSRIDSDGDRVTEKFEIAAVPDVARLRRLILERQQAA